MELIHYLIIMLCRELDSNFISCQITKFPIHSFSYIFYIYSIIHFAQTFSPHLLHHICAFDYIYVSFFKIISKYVFELIYIRKYILKFV